MKCSRCNREVKGTICSYCGEVLEVKEEIIQDSKKDLLRYAIIFAVLSLAFGVISNFFNEAILLGIVMGGIGIWLSVKYLNTKERKSFIWCLVIASIGLALTSISGIEVLSREIDKATASKKYSEILGVDIPKRDATTYSVDFGYTTGYKLVIYGYNITSTEYQEILDGASWLSESNFYIDLIDGDIASGYYAIFDYQENTWEIPQNKADYRFIVLRIAQKDGNYKLEIYDVSKRQY
ncbi:MAG: hypothetical protein PHO86_01050 [Bacilli bacterium]|nr:hypothetical protein [Bacilli bacterium]